MEEGRGRAAILFVEKIKTCSAIGQVLRADGPWLRVLTLDGRGR